MRLRVFSYSIIALAALLLAAGCESTGSSGAKQKPPSKTELISGRAQAIDGDTIVVNGKAMDLWGINAPNMSNTDGCFARAALDDFIGSNGSVTCTVKTKTKKRTRAICSNKKFGDLGRAILRGGWARVSRGVAGDRSEDSALAGVYDRTELKARLSRVGLWSLGPRR